LREYMVGTVCLNIGAGILPVMMTGRIPII
jgi:hypothetical protein